MSHVLAIIGIVAIIACAAVLLCALGFAWIVKSTSNIQ